MWLGPTTEASSGMPRPPGTAVSEALSRDVLSLPIHPYISEETQQQVAQAVIEAVTA